LFRACIRDGELRRGGAEVFGGLYLVRRHFPLAYCL
jgi:hypothetical protein